MISFQVILLRLVVAIVLGSLVGLEREIHEHSAGMRTIALVTLGCALFTIVSAYGFLDLFNSVRGLTLDPTKVASYIVAGIGFLGAGTIFMSRQNDKIKGLTTAASIWVMAAIGIACGTGLLLEACVTTALVLVVLVVFSYLEELILPRGQASDQHLQIEVEAVTGQLIATIYETCATSKVAIEKLRIHTLPEGETIEIACRATSPASLGHAIGSLRAIAGVRDIHASIQAGDTELTTKVNRDRKG